MAEEQFTVEESKKPSEGGCTTAMIGCLVVMLVLSAVACGLGYYAYVNFGVLVANLAESQANTFIDSWDLPEQQKTGMKEQISRVAESYREGEISAEQVQQVMEKLTDSPAMSVLPVEMARSQYIAPSGLTDAEKADAQRQLRRVAHGVFEKIISQEELDNLLEGHISETKSDGTTEVRPRLTDEELKAFIAASRELADSRQIPDEDFQVDLAAELKKAVDEVLLGVSAESAEALETQEAEMPNDNGQEEAGQNEDRIPLPPPGDTS